MAIRTGHGKGRGQPHVEVLPVDELPAGVPDAARRESPADRGERGLFARGNGIAAQGGRARAGKTKLADRMGLRSLPEGAAFAPYKRAAVSFRRSQCSELAKTVGGGVCGPAPSSLVASAALQLAWSRYLSDLAAEGGPGGADTALKASRLAEASRQSLLAAHELCAREAEARKASAPQTAPHQRLAALAPAPLHSRPASGRAVAAVPDRPVSPPSASEGQPEPSVERATGGAA